MKSLIKTKESVKDVKVLDRARAATHRVVGAAVRTKDIAELSQQEGSASEYGAELVLDSVTEAARDAGSFVTRRITSGSRRNPKSGESKEGETPADNNADAWARSAKDRKNNSKNIRLVKANERASEAERAAERRGIKNNYRTIKTAEQADKTAIKTPTSALRNEQIAVELTSQAAQKAKKAEKAVRESMNKAAQSPRRRRGR